jgi:hypothetical protein
MSCGNSRSSKCNPCGPSEAAMNEIANKAAYYARIAQYASDGFSQVYLGAKDVAPTTDNNGNPLIVGALYFNSTNDTMYVWDGTAWDVATNFNENTPFLSTGSTTARTLANRFADVVNVKDFGAVGDGVTDDTVAIKNAIAYAILNPPLTAPFGEGGTVFLPAGVYGVSQDIDIPEGVIVCGEGVRISTIKWIGGSAPTEAVITSNLDNRFSFVHAAGLTKLTVDANNQPVAVKIRGWNNGCELNFLEARSYTDPTDGGLQILSSAPGSNTATSANFSISDIWLFGTTGAKNILLDGCQRLTFINLNIAIRTGETGPMVSGLELRQLCRQNVFINPNIENCSIAVDISTTGAANTVTGNAFINLCMDFASYALTPPATNTINGVTGTFGFVVRQSDATNAWGYLQNYRDGYGYSYPFYDFGLKIFRSNTPLNANNSTYFHGQDIGTTTTPRINRIIIVNNNAATISVNTGNVLSIGNTISTSVTNFTDGIQGQVIHCRFTNGNTTIESNSTIVLNDGSNWNPVANSTLTLLFISNKWFEVARSYGASTGTYTISNVTTDRTYDANATTVDELADVLGTLIADLNTRGVI